MKPRRNDRQGMLTHYLKTLMRYAGIRAWVSLALIVFLGLSQGVGLVMLIPFLGLIGLGGAGDPDGISAHIGHMFDRLGVPMNQGGIHPVPVYGHRGPSCIPHPLPGSAEH